MNEKFVYDELKRLKSKKATGLDGMTARLLKDAAPVIAKPITYIINLTISTGEIPPELKEAKVTPIFKNGKRTEESNYRPISVLPLVSKVMERAIQVQLVKFIEANPGGGGVLPEKLGRGVRPASQTPYPIYDQNLRYSLPYLWPDQKFETLFMTCFSRAL